MATCILRASWQISFPEVVWEVQPASLQQEGALVQQQAVCILPAWEVLLVLLRLIFPVRFLLPMGWFQQLSSSGQLFLGVVSPGADKVQPLFLQVWSPQPVLLVVGGARQVLPPGEN